MKTQRILLGIMILGTLLFGLTQTNVTQDDMLEEIQMFARNFAPRH